MKPNKLNFKNARILGDFFLNIQESAPSAKIDMQDTRWSGSDCGTTGCHAGWFAWARSKVHFVDYDHANIKYYVYNYSANEMAEFLGFEDRYELEYWGENNEKIWGNSFGDDMFTSAKAFGKENCNDSLSLKTIGLHWLKVADRAENFLIQKVG